MRLEKIDGTKVTLAIDYGIDRDKDDIKSVDLSLKVTLDLAELFNELFKRDIPDALKKLLKIG